MLQEQIIHQDFFRPGHPDRRALLSDSKFLLQPPESLLSSQYSPTLYSCLFRNLGGYVGARLGAYWYPLAVGMDVDYLQRDSWLLRHVICCTL